jgi:anti-sigma-K factor RskA
VNRELLREQCEAYVLGQLSDAERQEIDALLDRGDPECTQALREASEVIAGVAWSAPAVEPPALLRTRVLKQLPAASAKSGKPNWLAIAGWAAAACLAIAAFMQYSSASRTRAELASARQEAISLSQQLSAQREVLDIVLSRDARLVPLGASGQQPLLRAFWSGQGKLVLAGNNVPAPAAGQTLQLWVVPKSGNPVSAGLFAPDAEGRVLHVAESLPAQASAAALAVSVEPAGGSPQPTTQPIYVGAVGD